VKVLNNAKFGATVGLVCWRPNGSPGTLGSIRPRRSPPSPCSGNSLALGHAVAVGSAAALMETAGKYIVKDVASVLQLAAEAGTDPGGLGAAADVVDRQVP
jgi:hypothetical protein